MRIRVARVSMLTALLAVSGCKVTNSPFSERQGLPATFHALAALALSEDRVLVGGSAPEAAQRDRWRSQLYLSDASGTRLVYDAPGAGVISLARAEGRLFATAQTPPATDHFCDSALVSSSDGGASFQVVGPLPPNTAPALAARSALELWAKADTTLHRSLDGGKSWRPVPAPTSGPLLKGTLALSGEDVLLLDKAVHATRDGGATWRTSEVGAGAVFAVVGAALLATVDGSVKLGAMTRDGARWSSTFPGDLQPSRLTIDNKLHRFLGTSGSQLVIFESGDAGQSWTRVVVPDVEGAADLGPGRSWFAVDGRRRIITPRPGP